HHTPPPPLHDALPILALHAADEPADREALERPQRVAPERREPHLTPETHGVRARPEELTTVVEVADAGARDDRETDPGVAQLREDRKSTRLNSSHQII